MNKEKITDSQSQNNKILFLSSLICFFALSLFFIIPMLFREVFTLDDLGRFNLPLRDFLSQCLKSGKDPTWFPGLYCGIDLHGEGQLGMLHPLHWFLYRFLPLDYAFNLEIILNYFFMIFGMYFLLRSFKIKTGPAMLGALIFTISGVNITHYVHINMLSIVSHLPWNLWFLKIILDSSSSRKQKTLSGLFLCLLTASQAHMGYPHYLFLCQLFELLFFIYLKPFKKIKSSLYIAWLKMLSVLIGASQILPTWQSFNLSKRVEETTDFLYTFSLHPENLFQFFSPYFFSSRVIGEKVHEASVYCGTFAILAVIYAISKKSYLKTHRPLFKFCSIIFIFSIILSLGKYGYLYQLQTKIPFLNIFRCPSRYILFTHFVMAVISSLFLNCLLKGEFNFGKNCSSMVLVVLSILIFLYGEIFETNTLLFLLAGPIFFLSFLVLIKYLHKGHFLAYALLPIVITIDQGYYGLSYIYSTPPQSIEKFLQSLPRPPDTNYRISTQHNAHTMLGHRLLRGYVGATPDKHIHSSGFKLAQVSSTEWASMITMSKIDGRQALQWRRVESPNPRCFLVTQAIFSDNPTRDIEKIDFKTTALVASEISLPPSTQSGSVNIVEDIPGTLKVKVHCEHSQLLVFSESYHPDWEILVNENRVKTLRVNGDFLGCVVPLGNHEVIFQYKSKIKRKGITMSILGFLCLIVSITFLSFKKDSQK